MNGLLTIVMYHYVRDLEGSPFPDIKGLTINQFTGQIGYLKKHYQVLSAQDIFNVVLGQKDPQGSRGRRRRA